MHCVSGVSCQSVHFWTQRATEQRQGERSHHSRLLSNKSDDKLSPYSSQLSRVSSHDAAKLLLTPLSLPFANFRMNAMSITFCIAPSILKMRFETRLGQRWTINPMMLWIKPDFRLYYFNLWSPEFRLLRFASLSKSTSLLALGRRRKWFGMDLCIQLYFLDLCSQHSCYKKLLLIQLKSFSNGNPRNLLKRLDYDGLSDSTPDGLV